MIFRAFKNIMQLAAPHIIPKSLRGVIVVICTILLLASCANEKINSVNDVSSSPASASTRIVIPKDPKPTAATTITRSLSTPKELSQRWLKGIPCKPPCWEGITPGVTSAKEAERILKENPIFENITISRLNPAAPFGQIFWNWTGDGYGGGASFDAQSPLQTVLTIGAAYPGFRLADVIQFYGQPTHVAAQAKRNPHGDGIVYSIEFVFAEKGFSLFTSGSRQPNLTEDVWLLGPFFFRSSLDAFSVARSVPSDEIIEWQGFKDFAYYCRDSEGGEVCKEK